MIKNTALVAKECDFFKIIAEENQGTSINTQNSIGEQKYS